MRGSNPPPATNILNNLGHPVSGALFVFVRVLSVFSTENAPLAALNHTTGLPGKSQYRGSWFGIKVINAATYLFGSQNIEGTSHVFDFSFPQFLSPFATYDMGTDANGVHTPSNRVITTGNCTTVVTSYPTSGGK